VGSVDENIKYTGDWMLWAKMLLISDIIFVAEPLILSKTPLQLIPLPIKYFQNTVK